MPGVLSIRISTRLSFHLGSQIILRRRSGGTRRVAFRSFSDAEQLEQFGPLRRECKLLDFAATITYPDRGLQQVQEQSRRLSHRSLHHIIPALQT